MLVLVLGQKEAAEGLADGALGVEGDPGQLAEVRGVQHDQVDELQAGRAQEREEQHAVFLLLLLLIFSSTKQWVIWG